MSAALFLTTFANSLKKVITGFPKSLLLLNDAICIIINLSNLTDLKQEKLMIECYMCKYLFSLCIKLKIRKPVSFYNRGDSQ